MTLAAATPPPIELDPSTWLDRYGDALFRYAVARVRNETVAEDMVQETLLAALSSADTFKGGSTEKTWLIGILRHKILDYFRKSTRERQLQRDWSDLSSDLDRDFDEHGSWKAPISDWATPEESLAQGEFWEVFDGCLDKLPEKLRTPFALRELEGLDSEALVETLNISTKNNLWVILSRARHSMRRCLQTQWFEQE